MAFSLSPTDNVEERDMQCGLRSLLYDGICSQIMGVLTGGAFLVAFALLLGASNFVIGLFAAVGPFTQILQIPSVYLVDRLRRRKAIVVISSILSRAFWVVVALLPWLAPEPLRVPLFIAALVAYFGLGSISGCAFNSWMRDFVPEHSMGRYFARRMAISIALGAALSIVAGVAIDFARVRNIETLGYSVLFSVGAAAGLAGAWFLARIPEPRMAPPVQQQGLVATLAQPFKDGNYRRLLYFLAAWNFAANLAGPFFVVYMLRRLGLSMTWVLGLSVVSQLVNVLFLRIWGKLADRFTNKSVLAVSGPLFMLSVLLWVFTTMPEKHVLTVPLLIGIHALSGMSTAGVALCSGNIALKAAPRGQATAFLATNALVSGMAATVAPLLAGLAADWFATRELTVNLAWTSQVRQWDVSAISLSGLDFLFIAAFLFGLYALHRLSLVTEAGEVEEEVVVTELYAEVRKSVKHVSNVAGLRQMTYFPYVAVRKVARTVATVATLGRNNHRNPDAEPPAESE